MRLSIARPVCFLWWCYFCSKDSKHQKSLISPNGKRWHTSSTMVSIFKIRLSKIAIATFLTLQRWQKLKCLLKSIKSMLLFRVKSHNKQIMALAPPLGTQTRARLRHCCTRFAPHICIVPSEMSVSKHGYKSYWLEK